MNIKGLWEYNDYKHAAEFQIAELEDKVAYLNQVVRDANAELDAKQRGIDFLNERNAILEKQVKKLTDEAKARKANGPQWVWDNRRGEYLQVLQFPMMGTRKDAGHVGMD